ncbi:MAG TPA: glycosyltransferase [Thermoanaerobaculia bacterium]|nr:glycosyltransferase [Thermoanaerobaculia bacterium]
MTIAIAIPTYNRGAILVDTLARLLPLGADAVIVVDQTPAHPPDVETRLASWAASGAIAWIRLEQPSIPKAMNRALETARTDLVLFLDDDIEPDPALVREHVAAHADPSVWAVAGQVLQPGEVPVPAERTNDDLGFRFNSDTPAFITNVMAGNLSVKRERALSIGGFDENFIGVAYRFESDFALRLVGAGGRIRFEPRASIRHLQLPTGGTRTYGDHRTSPSPMHSVGDYYFALRHRPDFWRYVLTRLRKNVLTRYHLGRPWAVAPKVVGEVRGLLLARRLWRQSRDKG